MYEYDDGEEGGSRSTGRIIGAVIGIVALALVGWFFVKPKLGGDDATGGSVIPAATDSTSPLATDGPDDSAGQGAATDDTVSTKGSTATTEAEDGPTTTGAAESTTTEATATTTAPTTAAPPPAAPNSGATYDTLPDGSPVPVVAVFDEAQITLTGAVPDEAAKETLQALAIANAKPGQAGTVANFLTINPDVPRGIGVRVVELTSARFPEGSAEILPPHAAELDRIVSIMNALPHVTALVIGHADQRGDEGTNFAVSAQRAEAVVNYVAANGIAPSRLSSRAVGETDLLTLNNEPAALALNRRTEIVFNGLLLG